MLEQARNITQNVSVVFKQVVVDLGFRGVDADKPGSEIIHRGKFKSLSPQQRGWLRRRQAVERAIGHLKSDHRLDRCWLQGTLGDALHAISCAAGYNLRWLLRAIVRLGIGPLFLCLLQMVLRLVPAPRVSSPAPGHFVAVLFDTEAYARRGSNSNGSRSVTSATSASLGCRALMIRLSSAGST